MPEDLSETSPADETTHVPEQDIGSGAAADNESGEHAVGVEPAPSTAGRSPIKELSENHANLETSVAHQEEVVRHAAAVVAAKRKRLVINRANLEKTRGEAIGLEAARDSLGTWLGERSRSLAVRLLDNLERQERQLERDERTVDMWAQAQLPVSEGQAQRLRSSFIYSVWVAFVLAIGLPTIFWLLNLWLANEGYQTPILRDVWWRYIVLGLLILVLVMILGLVAYFRGYIKMKVKMDEMLSRGKFLLGSVDQLRNERVRIDGLVPQVKERLEFLGAVLHEPWLVPGFGGNRGASRHLTDSLPANLQIASTANSNDPAIMRLRSKFLAEQFRPGLRREGVAELLRWASEQSGLSGDRVDLRVIDKDVSAYGLRKALLSAVRSPEVLEMVGRAQVSRIASEIQAGLGPANERPGIHITNPDALAGLEVGHDLLSEWKQDKTQWDDYVVEILEDGAAMSRLAFSGLGLSESRHTRFQSVAVAPERLHDQAGQLVEFVAMESDGVTGTEVSVRLDITEPMDVDHVALFAESMNALDQGHPHPSTQVIPSANDDDYTLA